MRAPVPVCALALGAALVLAGPASRASDDAPEAVRAAARALDEAASPARLAALSAAIAAQEAALADGRATLRALAERRAAAAAALGGQERDAFASAAALDRIGRAPALAWFTHPGGPAAAVRAASVIAAAAPALSARAARTRVALAALGDARRDAAVVEERLRALLAALQTLRASAAPGGAGDRTPQQIAAARQEAEAALAALAAVSPPPAISAAISAEISPAIPSAIPSAARQAPSPYPPPVPGVAALDATGLTLSVRAPARAIVRAPATSSLRYAGPGGGPGLTAILEPRAGVLFVLRGLDRIDRAAGDTLLAGEPFGALGGPPPASDEFLIDASSPGGTIPTKTLYIEVVVDGERDSPAAWFAPPNERTRG